MISSWINYVLIVRNFIFILSVIYELYCKTKVSNEVVQLKFEDIYQLIPVRHSILCRIYISVTESFRLKYYITYCSILLIRFRGHIWPVFHLTFPLYGHFIIYFFHTAKASGWEALRDPVTFEILTTVYQVPAEKLGNKIGSLST